jgi:hypothetical protein
MAHRLLYWSMPRGFTKKKEMHMKNFKRFIVGGLLIGALIVPGARALADNDGHRHIPPGHLPPPGMCRIWYPGTPPGHQPPPGDCRVLSRQVPRGAWLVGRDRTWDYDDVRHGYFTRDYHDYYERHRYSRDREIHKDVRDVREARQDVREDRQQLQKNARELNKDRAELRSDIRNKASKKEIAQDRREIREDVQKVRENRQDLRQSRDKLGDARQELRDDLRRR